MKILWVKSDFLHPTTKGGQIRTLEMIKVLKRRHEIHYVGFEDPAQPEGVARSGEYCHRAYPIRHYVPDKASLAFTAQVLKGLFSPIPAAIYRYASEDMKHTVDRLINTERFDRVVCDFLIPSINISRMDRALLFQHNVESIIWQRRAEHGGGSLARLFLQLQTERMFQYEDRVCREAGHVVAVSPIDAKLMRNLFGLTRLSSIPTGVDIDYFSPLHTPLMTDLVFVGSMDWLPNVDGVLYFVREILPAIRRKRPDCSIAIVGRTPPPEVIKLARDPNILVTGTVVDVRPFLWGAHASIVPLRIGGGTRLKIYESMAAGTPTISTTIGAEGLEISSPDNIRIADSPADFAEQCLELLGDGAARKAMAANARDFVARRFSWGRIASRFEEILEQSPGAR